MNQIQPLNQVRHRPWFQFTLGRMIGAITLGVLPVTLVPIASHVSEPQDSLLRAFALYGTWGAALGMFVRGWRGCIAGAIVGAVLSPLLVYGLLFTYLTFLCVM